jgi:hypothetical protein
MLLVRDCLFQQTAGQTDVSPEGVDCQEMVSNL